MNQPMWDWSKEDEDVVAVVEHSRVPDALFKYVDGVLVHRGRGALGEWVRVEMTVEGYRQKMGGEIHTRPKPPSPQWTIYNNDKPFGDLSDEQKGLFLLNDHNRKAVKMMYEGEWYVNEPDWHVNGVYQAVPPEPTMAELLAKDIPIEWATPEEAKGLASILADAGWCKRVD